MSAWEAVKAMDDLVVAMATGNYHAMHKAAFIWSQRRDHILAGEETWADQKFDPAWQPRYVDIELEDRP